MCGIAGQIHPAGQVNCETLESTAVDMANALRHRGPDDAGYWIDPKASVAFSFRRLAILDLSDAGHQPMISKCGRYVLVFNGEIYNHIDLRKEFIAQARESPPCFHGHSDTETLLGCITRWGIDAAVKRAVGMFAFAIWDRDTRTLTLGRDRLGEKPLYYGWAGSAFLFGSELKALKQHPAFQGEIDRNALTLFFRHKYIPEPHSIYTGIRKLLPGTLLHITSDQIQDKVMPSPVPYWSAMDIAMAGTEDPFTGDVAEAKAQLDTLLRSTIRGQMLADVPLGAFLSGGIDSSTVVALMQAQSDRPIRTFTVGFTADDYDEARHARKVAAVLGTDHTELYVTPKEAMDIIPSLPHRYDEPFGDSSQIPTSLIAQLARNHVTASLSGDGGDEVFGGYNRYALGHSMWQKGHRLPPPFRRLVARGLTTAPAEWWNRGTDTLRPILPVSLQHSGLGDKIAKTARALETDHPKRFYRNLVSDWPDPTVLVQNTVEPATSLTTCDVWNRLDDLRHCMMYLDTVTYLPGTILTKVDRASMSVSLESRAPYLDHRVMEFAWRLPVDMKIADGQGKWLLRKILYDYVPRELIERPKMGFSIPLGSWLRGTQREWANDLLSDAQIRRHGLLDPGPIREKWSEHLSGTHNWQHQLWNVLMFQAWQEAQ